MKKFVRLLWISVVFFVLLTLISGAGILLLVNNSRFQSYIAELAVDRLNDTFNTQIEVKNVEVNLFGNVLLYGVSAKDDHNYKFIQIEKAKLTSSWLDIIQDPNNFYVDNLTLYKPRVEVYTYAGETDDNFSLFIKKFENDKPSEGKFVLDASIKIIDGYVSIINENLPEEEKIWLKGEGLNAFISDLNIKGQDISAIVDRMSFTASRSFTRSTVDNLKLKFLLNRNSMSFKKLNLKTDQSQLEADLVFSYDSIKQFKEFDKKVIWDMQIKPSKIAYKDIRYFVPQWDKNYIADISGDVKGPLDDMSIQNINLKIGRNNIESSRLIIKNITSKYFNIHASGLNAKTSSAKLREALPTFVASKLPEFINRFGDTTYIGNVDLDKENINLQGVAGTSLGNANIDAHVNAYSSDHINYAGYISTSGIDLQTLLGLDQVKNMAGNIRFQGRGKKWGKMQIEAKGFLNYLELLHNKYNNISFDGKLIDESFVGKIDINSENIIADYDGRVDFGNAYYKFDFTSNIQELDMQKLGFSKNPMLFKGLFNGKIEFSNLNNIQGRITAEQSSFLVNDKTYEIENAYLESVNNGAYKKIVLNLPDKLEADIEGNFELTEVAQVVTNAFGEITSDFQKKKVSGGQDFKINVSFLDESLDGILPNVKIKGGTQLNGDFNTSTEDYYVLLTSPGFELGKISVGENVLVLDSKSIDDQLVTKYNYVDVQGIRLNDFYLSTKQEGDSTRIVTHFSTGKDSLTKFNLELYQSKDLYGNYVLGFAPSVIKINETDWYLNPTGDNSSNHAVVNFNTGRFLLKDIILSSNNQNLKISGSYEDKDHFDFDVDLQSLVLKDIIPKDALGKLVVNGVANGYVKIKKTGEEFKPLANLLVSNFGLNDEILGNIYLDASYNPKESIFQINGSLKDENRDILKLAGTINNNEKIPEINLNANFDNLNLGFVQSFLKGSLDNFRGYATGVMDFSGSVEDPTFNGVVEIYDFGMKLSYLGVDYLFEGYNDVVINKEKGGVSSIHLNNINFKDTKFKTKGVVSGMVLFNKLSQWYLDLNIETDNLLIMDTDIDDNETFYGRIFGAGDVEIAGEPSDLYILGKTKILKNTNVTINTGGTKQISDNSLVEFLNPNQDSTKLVKTTPKGITIELKLDVTPGAITNLVFDQDTGDRLEARGVADGLSVIMRSNGDIEMDGEYVLQSGTYYFRQVVPKDFNLKQGGTVKWTGSPYQADINVSADYFRTVSNIGDYLGIGFSPSTNIDLSLNISENLAKPKISFWVGAPDASEQVRLSLASKMADEDERLRQFGAILLTGKFLTVENNAALSTAQSTAADIVLRQVGQVITHLIKELDINFEYVEADQISQTSTRLETRLNFDLNPRVSINGSVGVPIGAAVSSNDGLTGAVEIDYDISKSGDRGLVIKAFSRPTTFGVENFNSSNSFAQSYGGGIVFRKSFDQFSELFQSTREQADLNDSDSILIEKISPVNQPSRDSIKKTP